MSDAPLFILAPDVHFIPVDAIHEKTTSSFQHDEQDVVLTHRHTRKSSKVLAHEAAALLKEFETPRSWAQVILDYSLASKKDPQELAEEAIDLLMEMQEQGFLVPYQNADQPAPTPLFAINDQFKGYTIKENLQFFDDSEVYRVQDAAGNYCAFKLLKNGTDQLVAAQFANETRILGILDGKVNPRLIQEGVEPGFQFIITEWCSGELCESKAKKIRNLTTRENVISMLDLCISIVNAYDHLHEQGIIHADVYPKNILITDSGHCMIIDYGIAVSTDSVKINGRGGGVCFYFEPEYAAAMLEKKTAPVATKKGEQYAVATLLYYLVTGRHYLDFSIEREKLFLQILQGEPISFQDQDLDLPVVLDDIFATALAKDPDKRYASLSAFAQKLREVRNGLYTGSGLFIGGKENAPSAFAEFIIHKFGLDSPFIRRGIILAPHASINYGSAGIAYMFYRMACVREEPKLLDLAQVWADHAGSYQAGDGLAFYAPEMGLSERTIGKRSIYYSETGVHLLKALISRARGDDLSVDKAIAQFLTAAVRPCDKIDVTTGRAGILIGCAMLLDEWNINEDQQTIAIRQLAARILDELWQELERYPDLAQPNAINYFGIAHGWAGILYATLQWCQISGQKLPEDFMRRVGEMENLFAVDGKAAKYPVSITDNSSWTGWCNGSAGHIFLWSLLYRSSKEEKYLSLAVRLANTLVNDTDHRINNLCCGMAGEAYAFLNLYRISQEKQWLLTSQQIARKIMSQISMPPLRNNSLYKGDPGLALLFCEMEFPERAQMPFFEIRQG